MLKFANKLGLLYIEYQEGGTGMVCFANETDMKNAYKTGFTKRDLTYYFWYLYQVRGAQWLEEELTTDSTKFWELVEYGKIQS
ncbi:MAG: hypothetical protein KA767_07475 [Saprospiraceae bacterium]|nr:hypothetical protein [Saprospiraceae bacterium]HMS70586.1 hypothetical protein [Saprospiraceae bacterium]